MPERLTNNGKQQAADHHCCSAMANKTATRLLLFLSVYLSTITIILLIAILLSAEWIKLDIPFDVMQKIARLGDVGLRDVTTASSPPSPTNTSAIVSNNTDNHANPQLLNRAVVLSVGVSRITVLIGSVYHVLPSALVHEGAYAATGFSIFAFGLIILQVSGFLLNLEEPCKSMETAKKLTSASSAFLRVGSGVMLGGMVVYTIRHSTFEEGKDHISRRIVVELLQDLIFDFGVPGEPRSPWTNVKDFPVRFRFGWCFAAAWTAAAMSFISGVLAWALSVHLGVAGNDEARHKRRRHRRIIDDGRHVRIVT